MDLRFLNLGLLFLSTHYSTSQVGGIQDTYILTPKPSDSYIYRRGTIWNIVRQRLPQNSSPQPPINQTYHM